MRTKNQEPNESNPNDVQNYLLYIYLSVHLSASKKESPEMLLQYYNIHNS